MMSVKRVISLPLDDWQNMQPDTRLAACILWWCAMSEGLPLTPTEAGTVAAEVLLEAAGIRPGPGARRRSLQVAKRMCDAGLVIRWRMPTTAGAEMAYGGEGSWGYEYNIAPGGRPLLYALGRVMPDSARNASTRYSEMGYI
jgi:hypothetical protein